MANRFDKEIGQRQEYIDTYAPIPLGLIAGLAKDRQDSFKSAIDDLEKTKGLLDVRTDPNNELYRDKLVKSYNDKITDIASRAATKGWTPEIQSEWLQAKNKMVSDPDRLRLKQYGDNYYEKYLKDVTGLSKDNKYGKWNEVYKRTNNPDAITPFEYTGMQAAENHAVEAGKFMGSPKADAFDKGSVIEDDEGRIIGVKDGAEALVSKKLYNIASTKAPDFLTTPAGQDFIRKVRYYNPEADYKYVLSEATDMLYNSKYEELFTKTKHNESLGFIPKWKRDEQHELSGLGQGQTIPGSVNVIDELPANVRNVIKTNAKGELEMDWLAFKSKWAPGTKESGDRSAEMGSFLNLDLSEGKKNTNESQRIFGEFLQKAKDVTGFKGPITSKDVNKLLNDYQHVNKVLNADYELTPVEQRVEQSRILSNRNTYEYFNDKGEKIENPLTIPSIAKTFSPDRRKADGGISKISGTYVDAAGKMHTINLRSTSLENNRYFDIPAKQRQAAVSYIKNGKVDEKVAPKLEEFSKQIELDKVTNNRLIDVQNVNGNTFITVVNPRNRIEQMIQRMVPNPNYKGEGDKKNPKFLFYDIGTPKDLEKVMTTLYYTGTREGTGDIDRMRSNKTLSDQYGAEDNTQQVSTEE